MAKQTAEYKNRYNADHYERISLVVPKGVKAKWQERAKQEGKSLNGLILEKMSN